MVADTPARSAVMDMECVCVWGAGGGGGNPIKFWHIKSGL